MIRISPGDFEYWVSRSWDDLIAKDDPTRSFHATATEFTDKHRLWVSAYLKHDLDPDKALREVVDNKEIRWSDMPKPSRDHQDRLRNWLKEKLLRR